MPGSVKPTLRRARLLTLATVVVAALAATAVAPAGASAASVFDGQGMWIWYVGQAEKGNVAKIAAKAKKHKVKTVFVKSSDGGNWWRQWDDFVAPLKAAGLKVCAWQYVYGTGPVMEANLAARAAKSGADCIVIDAEVEYKNRYSEADKYIKKLRSVIGSDYPVGFTSFAYPDFHPTIPYSVFLGPGGAQWNLPQMYFHAFKVKIPQVFYHTYTLNQIYQRPIHPLGQTYEGVSAAQALQFRRYAKRYRAPGYSWWVWHDTRPKTWSALGKKLPPSSAKPLLPYPLLRQGYKSDMVRWCKLKLNAAGAKLSTNLSYDARMTAAVRDFQTRRGLVVTGQVDAATWPVLQAVQLPPLGSR
ncbi:MAG: peptidoglycan-binding protein [Thermoleophilaceae bacterium]|nr:peptidoglycan-binding protein [Thermoleophilaceae bacterium]